MTRTANTLVSKPGRERRTANFGLRAHLKPRDILIALAIALSSARLDIGSRCLAQEPDQREGRFTVIQAGTIITNTGKEIRNGMIVIDGGKISNVGRGLEYPLSAKVIDARDRVVMPGLINPRTRYGMSNYNRSGVHGDFGVADEYYPPPDVYSELLDAGYTTVALIPAGSGIPGRAMVVRTAGAEDQRMLVSPAYLRVSPDKRTFRGALERAQKEIEKVEKAHEEFEKKQEQEKKKAEEEKKEAATQPATQATSQPAFQPPPIDSAHQVLVDLIQKKPELFALIELDGASDYVHFREVLGEFDIAHHFFARNGTQSDLEYVAEKLGEEKVQILLYPRMGQVPYSAERLNLVKILSDAGCEISCVPLNDSAQEHQRILGRVAELVREGWSREEALKAVTLHPARLLGLDKRFGSVEKDKEADLIFLDVDPLDPTARVREVMIGGEIVHRVEDYD